MFLLQILTDQRVIDIDSWLIVSLGGGLLATLVYIYNQRVKQTDAIAKQLGDFTVELKHKFRALNNLAKDFDTTKALHGKDLENLRSDHVKLDFNLREMAKQATEHNIEIKILKQKHGGL